MARLKLALLIAGALALGAVEREVWRQQMDVRGIAGDAGQYYRLAANLRATGTLSFDGKTPEWTRLPGYPLMLTALGMPKEGDRAAFSRWLVRAQWLNLGLDLLLSLLVVLIGRALGAGRWAWAGGAAWLLQPWATLAATIPLSDVAAAFLTAGGLVALAWAMRGNSARRWALLGVVAGAAQLVRGDSLLLLAVAVGAALFSRQRRGALLCICTFALLYAGWPIRNLARFGQPHFFGGGTNIDVHGSYFDRGPVMAWMRTWAVGQDATVGVGWRFPGRPLSVGELPPRALGTPEERAELDQILRRYSALGGQFDDDSRARLQRLANEMTWRHPLDTFILLPLQRMGRALAPPRDGFGLGPLPALVRLRPIYIAGDALLVVAALVALWRGRRDRLTLTLAAFVGLRLLLIGWMPTPEPRYFLPAVPVLYALAAAWRRHEA